MLANTDEVFSELESNGCILASEGGEVVHHFVLQDAGCVEVLLVR